MRAGLWLAQSQPGLQGAADPRAAPLQRKHQPMIKKYPGCFTVHLWRGLISGAPSFNPNVMNVTHFTSGPDLPLNDNVRARLFGEC